MNRTGIGISGFSVYLPRYRVRLADWCRWTGDNWDKVRTVVGSGFRMRGPDENAYTMAATAALRLIDRYGIDPTRIGFLALGTESSTDNSAGAVIVKGMLNDALRQQGRSPMSRACEVPEFKHACLGGIYAIKSAARYLACDGRDRLAIVVSADVAEYARGTSGEPTQGAGAVAMLMSANPTLLDLELPISGSASDYRGPDFRKPFLRFMQQAPGAFAQPRDFPVFNGKYSTTCYVDEVLAAMRDLFERIQKRCTPAPRPSEFLRDIAATFLHRPYQRMAETGLIMSYLLALSLGGSEDRAELASYATAAGVSLDELTAELGAAPEVYQLVREGTLGTELYPLATEVTRAFRSTPMFERLMTSLGRASVQDIGNLYSASLPAWLAAGMEDAAERQVSLAGRRILALGYGSGDAAEAIPMQVVPGWETAARSIGFAEALKDPVDLDESGYTTLHDGRVTELSSAQRPTGVFYIDRVGSRDHSFDDHGIEYYRFEG
ncbi:MAG: hydroxymethylglutaryl-CoA synthase family protein [Pseudomonadales bacterium]